MKRSITFGIIGFIAGSALFIEAGPSNVRTSLRHFFLNGIVVEGNADFRAGNISMAAESITSAELATGSVTSEDILAGAVTTDAILADAVTSSKIVDGGIFSDDIADNAITSSKILDGAVTGDDILAGAIFTSKLADGAVTVAKQAVVTIGSAPAAACTPGQIHLDTDESDDTNCTTAADNSICFCTATDTWVEAGN